MHVKARRSRHKHVCENRIRCKNVCAVFVSYQFHALQACLVYPLRIPLYSRQPADSLVSEARFSEIAEENIFQNRLMHRSCRFVKVVRTCQGTSVLSRFVNGISCLGSSGECFTLQSSVHARRPQGMGTHDPIAIHSTDNAAEGRHSQHHVQSARIP